MNHTIIGHDIDGRPLRVGDEVVLVDSELNNDPDLGKLCTVVGPSEPDGIEIKTGTLGPDGTDIWDCGCHQVRKINQDHQPAGSFEDVMAGLRNKETNDERV